MPIRSQSVEDYLKAVYDIGRAGGRVMTTALAERLDVSPASVTGMVKKLASLGLLEHAPYQGGTLTEPGRQLQSRPSGITASWRRTCTRPSGCLGTGFTTRRKCGSMS